jgi:hypothetical protein
VDADAGAAMRYRDRLGRRDLAMLYNVSAEFADSLDRRSAPRPGAKRGVLLASRCVLVSGQITGEAAKMADLEAVKAVLPDVPVLANTGVKHATVAEVLRSPTAASSARPLKVDGNTWNAVDPSARRGLHGQGPESAGRMSMQDRIKRWTEALMMIPGLSGFEGNVRRYIRAELKALGVESKTDMLGNLIATIEGDPNLPSVMVFGHMDQLGLIVRKIEADGADPGGACGRCA